MTEHLPSLGITHCIPWKSSPLGCGSNPRRTKNIEDEGSTNTALLQHSCRLYCPTALSSNLLSARSTDQAARHLQIPDNKSQLHTDQLCTLPPVNPGQTDGLFVDSKSLAGLGWRSAVTARVPATFLARLIYPRHTGFPACATCTCDARGTCWALHSRRICSARVGGPAPREARTRATLLQHEKRSWLVRAARVNFPKPHSRAQHKKLLFSLVSFCLNFAASLSCISFSSAPAWKNYSETPGDGHL